MSKHMAQVKNRRALKHRTLSAADYIFSPGDKVLVWMENQRNNRIGLYKCPFSVLSFDPESKIVLIEEERRKTPKRYNAPQVKNNMTETEPIATEYMQAVRMAVSNFSSSGGINVKTPQHANNATMKRTETLSGTNINEEVYISQRTIRVSLTEVIRS